MRIGIHHDVEAALGGSVNAGELHAALYRYTRNGVYLSKMQEGAPRIDLAGEVAGIVTAREARMAAETLRRRGAKVRDVKAPAPASDDPSLKMDSRLGAPVPARLSLNDLKVAALARRRASLAAA